MYACRLIISLVMYTNIPLHKGSHMAKPNISGAGGWGVWGGGQVSFHGDQSLEGMSKYLLSNNPIYQTKGEHKKNIVITNPAWRCTSMDFCLSPYSLTLRPHRFLCKIDECFHLKKKRKRQLIAFKNNRRWLVEYWCLGGKKKKNWQLRVKGSRILGKWEWAGWDFRCPFFSLFLTVHSFTWKEKT